MANFDLTKEKRASLYRMLINRLEAYYENTSVLNVASKFDPQEIRCSAQNVRFDTPADIEDAVLFVTDALTKYAVHISHPMYYGLFNPRANFPAIVADLITATYNPQLAAWSHSPWAAEVENFLISEFGQKIGFPGEETDGVFATGGAEANITALLCALCNSFPDVLSDGVTGISARPIIYCSSESHHSIVRAAKVSGLGSKSVRMIQTDEKGVIRIGMLEEAILKDKSEGYFPLMVVGTAGTTGTGSIDDFHALAAVARQYLLYFHIDAAWGGAVVLNPVSRQWVSGIELADSVTFDVHKWLSVPMSASMFITRHRELLGKTFRLTTEYMPRDAEGLDITDPYAHSIQWSRRFIGLKLYLSMMVFGWDGYSQVIGRQIEMGNHLRSRLTENNWLVTNNTPLPLVCFTDPERKNDADFAKNLCSRIVNSGEAWVSVYPVNGINSIRACITNYNTSPDNINALVEAANKARTSIT